MTPSFASEKFWKSGRIVPDKFTNQDQRGIEVSDTEAVEQFGLSRPISKGLQKRP
jgi:hypothetical protein